MGKLTIPNPMFVPRRPNFPPPVLRVPRPRFLSGGEFHVIVGQLEIVGLQSGIGQDHGHGATFPGAVQEAFHVFAVIDVWHALPCGTRELKWEPRLKQMLSPDMNLRVS